MNKPKTAVRIATVDAEQVGRRLDNVLLALIKGAPRSLIYKLLRSGQVRVNGGRVKPQYRVAEGDQVRIPPLEVLDENKPNIPGSRLAQLKSAILLEDEDYLIIDKPSGLSCHAGSAQRYGVIEVMRAVRPDIKRLDLGHRLDRETSGCLVLSKHLTALQHFHAVLRERATEKIYAALLRDLPPAGMTRIEAALEVSRQSHGERRAAVSAAGKTAATEIVDCTPCGPHALVRLRLETGRMHQIRAHAQHIGLPVAGDRDYGDAEFNRALRPLGLKRLFLHAESINFEVPSGPRAIQAALPAELDAVIASLQHNSSARMNNDG